MKRNLTKMFMLLSLSIVVWSCGSNDADEIKEIVVVSTNDIHASIENATRLVTYVDQLREEHENVLVLDAGDRFTGNPYVDKADPRGEPILRVLESAGYDYFAVGNHEFDYNISGLKKTLPICDAELLCANADFSGTELAGAIKPYDITEIDNLKVAIVGLIQLGSNGLPSSLPDNMEGIKFRDGVEVSLEYGFLRDSADVVIALSHMGFTGDSIMVCKNKNFDLVIGGHSHTYIPNGRNINGTLVTQAGSHAENVGVTTISIKGDRVVSVVNEVVSLEGVEPDPESVEYYNRCREGSTLSRVIGQVDITIDESGLTNLIGESIIEGGDAEITLVNSGSIRIDSIAAGDVIASQIYELEPFNNHIVSCDVTLLQLKGLILPRLESGVKVRSIDLFPCGFKYEIVVDKDDKAQDILFYDMGGRPLADRVYRLALSNYVYSAYKCDGRTNIDDTGLKIADVMIDRVERAKIYKADNSVSASIVKR